MVLSSPEKTLGKVIALSGVIQGFTWTVLSLISIILYNVSNELDLPTSYAKSLEYIIYYRYIHSGDLIATTNVIIRPFDFTIFMWLYLFLCSTWLAMSVDQFIGFHYNKARISTVLVLGGLLTLSVSLIDLILTALLARDYSTCDDVPTDVFCFISTGIIMSIAARGYTLWVINLGFSYVSISMALKIRKIRHIQQSIHIPRAKLGPNEHMGTKERSSPNFSDSTFQLPAFMSREDKYGY